MSDLPRTSPLRRLAIGGAVAGALLLLSSTVRTQIGFEANGEWLRSWVASNGPVTIIVGPVFRPSDNADRVITYRTVGDNRVAVPTHLFKIIIDNSDPLSI